LMREADVIWTKCVHPGWLRLRHPHEGCHRGRYRVCRTTAGR
jgi:hypothetical protein